MQVKLFKRSPQQLQHYTLEGIVIKRSLKRQENHKNELNIYIDDKVTSMTASIIPLVKQSGLHSLMIFCTDNNDDT